MPFAYCVFELSHRIKNFDEKIRYILKKRKEGSQMKQQAISMMIFSFILYSTAFADEINLNNGDRITGEIIEQTESTIFVKTKAMGVVEIDVDCIKPPAGQKEEKEPQVEELKREISIDYTRQSGNTKSSSASFDVFFNKRMPSEYELTGKIDVQYSSSNKKMNNQKWYTLGRYAQSFGLNKDWYRFCKLEVDHDKFANINYRATPGLGIGYWLHDEPDYKFLVEAALGYEYTSHRDSTEDGKEVILVPRMYFEKAVIGSSMVSQELTIYPAIDDPFGKYRYISTSAFTTPISEVWSLRLRWIINHNSNPAENAEKTDIEIRTGLICSF